MNTNNMWACLMVASGVAGLLMAPTIGYLVVSLGLISIVCGIYLIITHEKADPNMKTMKQWKKEKERE